MFKINRIGYKYTHSEGIYFNRPCGSGDYLLLCLKSHTMLIIDGEEIEINPPCFMIYKKCSPQEYRSLDNPFINDWIHFDSEDEDINTFITSLKLPFNTPLYIHNETTISSKIQTIANEFWKPTTHHDEIIDLLLKALFYSLSDTYHEERKVSDKLNRHRPAFNEIRSYIYSFEEQKKITVELLAARLNLSISYFQHIYKELYGVPVTHDIILSRIDYARNLLVSSYDSISDIAARCGYESPEHFTRQFKEITGYTPKQYRDDLLT